MIAIRLCWPIFALWYMCWGTTPHLVSTEMTTGKFKMEKGVRYGCGVLDRRRTRSVLGCSGECTKEKSCYGFNYGSGLCELLSAAAAGRADASGWTHGRPEGKYKQSTRETLVS